MLTIELRGVYGSEVREISSSPQQRDESNFTDVSYSDMSRSLASIERHMCQTSVYCSITAEAGRVCICGRGGYDARSINETQCQDVNASSVKNGNCEHTCTNTQGD